MVRVNRMGCTPLERLRSPKIFDMSIFDWLISLLLAFFVAYIFKIKMYYMIPFLFSWILFGVSVHAYFNIPTMLGFYLGLNKKPVRLNAKC